MKKILLFLVFLSLFMPGILALSLALPDQIPSNINWSFYADLDSTTDFDEVRVSVDGKQVLIAYANGQVAVDPFNGQFVSRAFTHDKEPSSTAGLTLVVSYLGLPTGEHRVSTSAYRNGTLVSETEGKFSTFDALSKGYKVETDKELERLKTINSDLEKKLREISTDSSKLDSLLKEKEEDLQELSAVVETIKTSLKEFDSELEEKSSSDQLTKQELEELKSSLSTLQGNIAEVESDLTEMSNESPGLGVAFANVGNFVIAGLVVLLLVGIAYGLFAFFGNSENETSLFKPDTQSAYTSSTEKKGKVKEEEESDGEETSLQSLPDESFYSKSIDEKVDEKEEKDWHGKWEYNSERKPARPLKEKIMKAFHLSDLIKKKEED